MSLRVSLRLRGRGQGAGGWHHVAMHRIPAGFALAALSVLCLSSFACKTIEGVDGESASAGPNAMLDEVAVGQARCPDEDGDARPFVVEWDATDLATFEAKAGRDLVFVNYEGCEIELLYGCSDNGVPGRYGAYDTPMFTSGTVESFEMRNQEELWAKLPLGAASVGAQLSAAESLELQYFVSGTVMSTRNYIERATIADNARCAKATHYVAGYNLGAFRLLAHEQATRKGQAGAVGGGREAESANLKQGGDIEDCESRTQQRCRVPIRLVLQQIDESAQDLDASAASAPRPDPKPEPAAETVSERAEKLREAALDKADARDAAGCLADLDRADALIDTDETRKESVMIRSYCTMLTDCDGGTELFHEALALWDPDKQMGKYQVIAAETKAKIGYCALEQMDPEFQASVLFERTREAARRNQPARCEQYGKAAQKLIPKLEKMNSIHLSTAKDVLSEVSRCFSLLSRCEDSRRWAVESGMLYAKGRSRAEVEAEALDIWDKTLKAECER